MPRGVNRGTSIDSQRKDATGSQGSQGSQGTYHNSILLYRAVRAARAAGEGMQCLCMFD